MGEVEGLVGRAIRCWDQACWEDCIITEDLVKVIVSDRPFVCLRSLQTLDFDT